MAESGNLAELVDNIFADDKVNTSNLKDFLKLVASRLSKLAMRSSHALLEEDDIEYEGTTRIHYLSDLITRCEERLAKLVQTPKTRLVIRNEGQKLQSIVDSLETVKCTSSHLQAQINDIFVSQEKLKKLECQRRQTYQDMIDRLYKDSMDSDICNLRKMFYILQNQVDELTVKFQSMENNISDIRNKMESVAYIPELEEKVNKLTDWRASLREEFDVLTERYEHIKTVKASKCELADLLEKKVNYGHLSKYVPKTKFDLAKQDFINEFQQVKELFCELQICFNLKLQTLHKNVQTVLSKLDSKSRLERRH